MAPIVSSVPDATTRDFTVAVIVVHENRVLLHIHKKLGRWLPPGGHIEQNELPDEAAVREVLEETGVTARLVCDNQIDIDLPGQPKQLCRPAGIQLALISPGHEHIDLVYLATGNPAEEIEGVRWFSGAEWADLSLTEEVTAWCRLALSRLKATD